MKNIVVMIEMIVTGPKYIFLMLENFLTSMGDFLV